MVSPGWPPQLSRSSWTLTVSSSFGCNTYTKKMSEKETGAANLHSPKGPQKQAKKKKKILAKLCRKFTTDTRKWCVGVKNIHPLGKKRERRRRTQVSQGRRDCRQTRTHTHTHSQRKRWKKCNTKNTAVGWSICTWWVYFCSWCRYLCCVHSSVHGEEETGVRWSYTSNGRWRWCSDSTVSERNVRSYADRVCARE